MAAEGLWHGGALALGKEEAILCYEQNRFFMCIEVLQNFFLPFIESKHPENTFFSKMIPKTLFSSNEREAYG